MSKNSANNLIELCELPFYSFVWENFESILSKFPKNNEELFSFAMSLRGLESNLTIFDDVFVRKHASIYQRSKRLQSIKYYIFDAILSFGCDKNVLKSFFGNVKEQLCTLFSSVVQPIGNYLESSFFISLIPLDLQIPILLLSFIYFTSNCSSISGSIAFSTWDSLLVAMDVSHQFFFDQYLRDLEETFSYNLLHQLKLECTQKIENSISKNAHRQKHDFISLCLEPSTSKSANFSDSFRLLTGSSVSEMDATAALKIIFDTLRYTTFRFDVTEEEFSKIIFFLDAFMSHASVYDQKKAQSDLAAAIINEAFSFISLSNSNLLQQFAALRLINLSLKFSAEIVNFNIPTLVKFFSSLCLHCNNYSNTSIYATKQCFKAQIFEFLQLIYVYINETQKIEILVSLSFLRRTVSIKDDPKFPDISQHTLDSNQLRLLKYLTCFDLGWKLLNFEVSQMFNMLISVSQVNCSILRNHIIFQFCKLIQSHPSKFKLSPDNVIFSIFKSKLQVLLDSSENTISTDIILKILSLLYNDTKDDAEYEYCLQPLADSCIFMGKTNTNFFIWFLKDVLLHIYIFSTDIHLTTSISFVIQEFLRFFSKNKFLTFEALLNSFDSRETRIIEHFRSTKLVMKNELDNSALFFDSFCKSANEIILKTYHHDEFSLEFFDAIKVIFSLSHPLLHKLLVGILSSILLRHSEMRIAIFELLPIEIISEIFLYLKSMVFPSQDLLSLQRDALEVFPLKKMAIYAQTKFKKHLSILTLEKHIEKSLDVLLLERDILILILHYNSLQLFDEVSGLMSLKHFDPIDLLANTELRNLNLKSLLGISFFQEFDKWVFLKSLENHWAFDEVISFCRDKAWCSSTKNSAKKILLAEQNALLKLGQWEVEDFSYFLEPNSTIIFSSRDSKINWIASIALENSCENIEMNQFLQFRHLDENQTLFNSLFLTMFRFSDVVKHRNFLQAVRLINVCRQNFAPAASTKAVNEIAKFVIKSIRESGKSSFALKLIERNVLPSPSVIDQAKLLGDVGNYLVAIRLLNQEFLEGPVPLLIARYMQESGQFLFTDISKAFEKAVASSYKREKTNFYLGRFLDSNIKNSNEGGIKAVFETVKAYIKSSISSENFDLISLPRIFTLWLNIRVLPNDEKGYQKLLTLLKKFNDAVSSKKYQNFLALLISRIGHPLIDSFTVLKSFIAKSLIDYFDFTIWNMIVVMKSTFPCRSKRALEIVSMVKKNKNCWEQYKSYDAFTQALISVAKFKSSTKEFSLSTSFPVVNRILASASISVPFRKNFSHFNGHENFKEFVSKVECIASLQRPKKIQFLSSSGALQTILLKPKDDLQKDARIMEIFRTIDMQFQSFEQARQRQLTIHSYSVTPLNEYCGIIEWIPNTSSFRSIIQGEYEKNGIQLVIKDIQPLFGPHMTADFFANELLPRFDISIFNQFLVDFRLFYLLIFFILRALPRNGFIVDYNTQDLHL